MFHDGDLQSGISLAVQRQKAVLCFVHDDTQASVAWESILSDDEITSALKTHTVALKLKAGSQEAGFLSGICPLNSTPAIVVIRNAAVQANLQSAQVPTDGLKEKLTSLFGSTDESQPVLDASPPPTASEEAQGGIANDDASRIEPTAPGLGYLDLQESSGRFRLPNNAYDALRIHTQTLLENNEPPQRVLESQLTLLERLPIFRDEARRIRSSTQPVLSDTARDRLLRLPAAAIKAQPKPQASSSPSDTGGQPVYTNQASTQRSAPTSPSNASSGQPPPTHTHEPGHPPNSDPPSYSTSQHQTQREDYIRMQKQREQSQRDERDRIKAQIKVDQEERRRKEEVRKQNEAADGNTSISGPAPTKPKSNEIRLQVRTFDGSTLRNTFKPDENITDVRLWIDSSTPNTIPYNLKLILTPLPNRNIEASEEVQSLSELGIKGSGTFVMVPVKGYVESYTGSTPTGLIGSAVSGGYSLVTGTAGALFGGVRSILGFGGQEQGQQHSESTTVQPANAQAAGQRQVRVRTLADQRLEERGRDQQFYNGNQLNFEPNRDDEDGRKND